MPADTGAGPAGLSPRAYLRRGKAHFDALEYDAAVADLSVAAQTQKFETQARLLRARTFDRQRNWQGVIDDLSAVQLAQGVLGKRHLRIFANALGRCGKVDAAEDIVDGFVRDHLLPDTTAEGPVVFIAGAPKSGSTSLSVALAAALGVPQTTSLSYSKPGSSFPRPALRALERMRNRGIVNHCHLDSDRDTLDALARLDFVKVAVHLRHPAEAVVSSADVAMRVRAPFSFDGKVVPDPSNPGAFLDWAIDNYTPRLIGWMQGWLAAYDAGHPSIASLTTLDDMIAEGQDALAHRIVSGMGLTPMKDVKTQPRRTGQRATGAQAMVLSAVQSKRIHAQIPATLLERFGWPAS